ncbi:hypothetical protein CK203_011897 [Vitis vinifera]|uniref:Uncharacterized protein n=1 Tax=Vitis vinifera TaxID=29760 RepID=A0A438K0R9_VITVI|nr:hypothetical protein CK203_011897 [Vitis vinifera]
MATQDGKAGGNPASTSPTDTNIFHGEAEGLVFLRSAEYRAPEALHDKGVMLEFDDLEKYQFVLNAAADIMPLNQTWEMPAEPVTEMLEYRDHKTVKLADSGLAGEESLTEMKTAETGTYRAMGTSVEDASMSGMSLATWANSMVENEASNGDTSCGEAYSDQPLPCDNGTDGFDPHIPPDDKESLGSVHAMVNHAEEQLG